MICNLVCEVRLRHWTTPVLVIAYLTKWDWLMMKCISMKVKAVPKGGAMSEIESALMYLGLGFALSVIFIGKRSGGSIRNSEPPANHVKPAPPPPPPLTHTQRMREREVAAIESMTAPESRLAAILKANKHKFDIDHDGVIHIKLDHPEVIAEMCRQIESMSSIRSRSG